MGLQDRREEMKGRNLRGIGKVGIGRKRGEKGAEGTEGKKRYK